MNRKPYGVNELREMFLLLFESKGHLRLPSFSLIPQNDQSLLLINSGMAPMKPYFKGEGGAAAAPHGGCAPARSASGRGTSRTSARRPATGQRTLRCWATSRSAITSSGRPSPGAGEFLTEVGGPGTRSRLYPSYLSG